MQVGPGVFRDKHGLRAYKRTKVNGLETKRFKPEELAKAQRWREEVAARAVLKLPRPTAPVNVHGPTLADDATRYLAAIQGMTTYADRARHVAAWVAVLGDRPRSSITSLDVRRCLEEWRKAGTLALATLNLRRTALMHLFNVLDADSFAPNPVARVKRYPEPEQAMLTHPPNVIASVLAKVPDSRYKRILAVSAWTGWPYALILHLTPPDLSRLKQKVARVTPRRKGGGTEGRWLPLVPEAVKALRALRLPDDLQGFHRRVAWTIWRKGCLAAKVEPCRPYDLRHSFGTRIAKASRDARAVQELLMHSTLEQSLRYTKAAGAIRAANAIRLATSGNSKGRKPLQNAPKRSRRKAGSIEGKRGK